MKTDPWTASLLHAREETEDIPQLAVAKSMKSQGSFLDPNRYRP